MQHEYILDTCIIHRFVCIVRSFENGGIMPSLSSCQNTVAEY